MATGRSGRHGRLPPVHGCVGHGSAERLRRYVLRPLYCPAELASVPTHLDYVVMVETEGNEFG